MHDSGAGPRPAPLLVTGAGGLIGSALVPALLGHGFRIAAIDCDSPRLGQFNGTGLVESFCCDITDVDDIAHVVSAVRPGAIVHLAARHLIPECEAEPLKTVATNLDGLVNVLAAAGAAGTSRLVFASTADVYAASGDPLTEVSPACPSTVYGATKLLGERLVAEWASGRPERRSTSLRIFNVYGPHDANPHVIPEILQQLVSGDAVRVGNATTRRDFIHVDDVAELICRTLLTDDPPPLVNAGTGRSLSIAGIIHLLEGLVDRPLRWSTDSAKMRTSDRHTLCADTTRMRATAPGFEPRSIEVGLSQVLSKRDIPKAEV